MKRRQIVLLGPPGSGKGTLCSDLAAKMGTVHISTGGILREAVRKNSPLGIKAAQFMNAGSLVPDEMMMKMVKDRLTQKDCSGGFLLDGYPRTIPQAESLDEQGARIDAAISLKVSEELCVKRLTSRRSCPKCGAIYNLATQAPSNPDLCDRCGSRLVLREDDRPETVAERFRVYQKQTAPLIAYYKESNRLIETDGSLSSKKVFENVKNVL